MTQKNYSINAESQRNRLLARLLTSPITTLQAREELDIMNPSQRVFELKALGYNIKTHRETVGTGKAKHRMAAYVLLAKA
ncbi:MAG: helix-turn-helix domain-containing protein [Methylococcaceae bacterium]